VTPASRAAWETSDLRVGLEIPDNKDLVDSLDLEDKQVLQASLEPVVRRDFRDSLAVKVCFELYLQANSAFHPSGVGTSSTDLCGLG